MSTLRDLLLSRNSITNKEYFNPFCVKFKGEEDCKLFYYDLFYSCASIMHDYISYTCEDNPNYANIKAQFTKRDHIEVAMNGFRWNKLLDTIEIKIIQLKYIEYTKKRNELTFFLKNFDDFSVFTEMLLVGSEMAHCIMENCYKNPDLTEKALDAIQLWTKHNTCVSEIIYGKNKTQSDEVRQSKNTEETPDADDDE